MYIDNLPSCECYEKSYMHRDVITHILVTKLVFYINNKMICTIFDFVIENLLLKCINTGQTL